MLLLAAQAAIAADPLVVGRVVGPSGEPVAACRPLSTTAPASLNVEAAALRYGILAPCSATVDVFLWAKAPLRSITGTLHYLDGNGRPVHTHAFAAQLVANGAGMRTATVYGEPVTEAACRELQLGIAILRCRGDGGEIGCPAMRVKGSYVFERVIIHAPAAETCVD